jgi:hypothetical protein
LRRTYAHARRRACATLYNFSEYRKFRRDEPRIIAKFDAVLATSERDRRALARVAPRTPGHVIPNG